MTETSQGAAVDAVRADVQDRRQNRALALALVLVFVLVLVSVFSAGLFLYAVVVVAIAYGVAMISGTWAQQDLTIHRHLSHQEVELGQPAHVRVVIHNRKAMPAFWLFWQDRIEDGLDAEGTRAGYRTISADAQQRLSYRLHTTRRGLFRIGPLVTEASDPLGLVRRYRVDEQASFLTVLPAVVAMGQGWPLGHQPIHKTPRRRSLFEDPSRFWGIRAYRQGDGLRRVHWRATARSRELQVKVFESAVLDGMLLAVEMGRQKYPQIERRNWAGVDPNEELVITAAASLGQYVISGGQSVALLANGADAAERYPVDWRGGSFRRFDEAVGQTQSRRRLVTTRPLELAAGRGVNHWQRLRLLLARLSLADGAGLAELLHLDLPRLPRSLVLMVVTPTVDQELVSVLGSLRRSGFDCGVVWARVNSGDESAQDELGAAAGLPEGIPLYRIRRAADLESLGNQRL